MPKSYYPVNLDVENKKCVVVGGGKVAERKIAALLKFGVQVLAVSPEFTRRIRRLAASGKIEIFRRTYRRKDVRGAVLVIAATDDPELNRSVADDARRARALVNVVDQPALCSFIAPSVIKRGPLVVSISTSGQAPALSKKLRLKLEKIITPQIGRLAEELGRIRRKKLGTAPLRA